MFLPSQNVEKDNSDLEFLAKPISGIMSLNLGVMF